MRANASNPHGCDALAHYLRSHERRDSLVDDLLRRFLLAVTRCLDALAVASSERQAAQQKADTTAIDLGAALRYTEFP